MSRCDIMLDLSGGAPLFPAADLRDGYLRADPGDPAAVLRAVLKARDLAGTFDKPRYITFTEDLCAHSRSNIVGCRRCLDLCPTGAIAPDGDHVAIDRADLRRLRPMRRRLPDRRRRLCAAAGRCAAAQTAHAAHRPIARPAARRRSCCCTTSEHGGALIDALARHGDGLPANVLPLAVNEVTQVGLEAVAAAFAYGASRGALPAARQAAPRRRRPAARPSRWPSRSSPASALAGARVATIETDDPDALGERLARDRADGRRGASPRRFAAVGGKRDVVRLALRELHARGAGAGRRRARCPQGAPFGTVEVNVEGCTLCLVLRLGLPDRRAVGRSGAADAALRRGRLRAMRAVQGDLPGEGHHAQAAARLPRRHRAGARAQGGGAVLLHPLRQAVRREELGRARRGQARRQALDVQGLGKQRLDVIKMCDDCRVAAMAAEQFRPVRAATPASCAPPTIICASASRPSTRARAEA